ncbi:hypothetical protein [Streptomyces cellostaticus]|uniref:hypothetical protein n=1 Tax=Streptomyces cellostaticus TaxID=67285 RepID=UPI00202619F3|nr:hypothetical protein [Streptomyces cellostaticus]
MPDAVWRRFLDDTEQAIRASAPRELSAYERLARARRAPVDAVGAVGELWQAEEPRRRSAWRHLDRRARYRQAGRVLCAIAAVVLAVAALSRLPPAQGARADERGEDTPRRSGVVLPDGVPVDTVVSSAESRPFDGAPPVLGSVDHSPW